MSEWIVCRDLVRADRSLSSPAADAALQQIREKGYDQAYQQRGKKLILMGINFDTEQRNVAEWRVETI